MYAGFELNLFTSSPWEYLFSPETMIFKIMTQTYSVPCIAVELWKMEENNVIIKTTHDWKKNVIHPIDQMNVMPVECIH